VIQTEQNPISWKSEKFDPTESNPDLIEIKFGTVDYVSQATPHEKFYVYLTKGASRQIGEIYAKKFCSYPHAFFFLQRTYRSDPVGNFYVQ